MGRWDYRTIGRWDHGTIDIRHSSLTTAHRPPPTALLPAAASNSRTAEVLRLLRTYESPNVTYLAPDGSWPIVWERARGVTVWDAEGRRYLDLTAAFGVAAAGHGCPAVVRAGQRQMATLLHAMGDVHPHALKARLARELSGLTFERWGTGTGRTLFANSGFEAVEAALKSARLGTGRPGIIAFEGAYHGLGYGTLNATHRSHFRAPFLDQLREFGHFLPYPHPDDDGEGESKDARSGRALDSLDRAARRLFRTHSIGAILVEPVQARGGIRVPPRSFLPLLRRWADDYGAWLIVDEIYTGLGRTGRWFACEHGRVSPDVICLGKALTGGFPLSACVGRADLMEAAWPPSTGEAIHTSTFLGHPVGCAMALAQLAEIRRRGLPERAARLGRMVLRELQRIARRGRQPMRARGLGLMAGLELRHPDGSPDGDASLRIVQRMLQRGYLVLPEGPRGEVIGLTPPLTIPEPALRRAIRTLEEELGRP